MLKIQEVRELIKLIDESDIEEFKFEQDGTKIKMKKSGAKNATIISEVQVQADPVARPTADLHVIEAKLPPVIKEEPSPAQDELHKITSPMVGTFYESPSPELAPFIKKGDNITKESVVCIVEAMKLFNEIEAEVNGEIVEILVKNGQLVEFGQPLFLVKAE